jgi:hypothetical protein
MTELSRGNQLLVAQMEREMGLDPRARAEAPGRTLWHYTGEAGMRGILSSREIRATYFRDTNDARELVAGEELIADEALRLGRQNSAYGGVMEQFRELQESGWKMTTLPGGLFIASFCEDEGDILSQWQTYGDGGSATAS